MLDPSTTSQSRAWVEVRLDHLRENALAVHRALGSSVELLPMVKADAYGLGMAAVTRALAGVPDGRGPWAFGVATVAEGESLRAQGWSGRVVVFSPAPPGEFERAGRADLALCLSEVAAVERWAGVAEALSRELAFHTEIDTGMGRAGFWWRDAHRWGSDVARIAQGRLRWQGCFTHFHSADEPDLAPSDEQWERFRQALDSLPTTPEPRLVHVANSAATLRRAGYGCDLVRPGIYLYGGCAGPSVVPLPVATVRARIVLVKTVPPGATVGYGATYMAQREERWGTLAIGYGDGLPRALARGGGSALVRGRRVPIIGRISMDMTTVDLTEVPEAEPGEVVTLIGRDGDAEITLDEVAAQCGTISYEILTGLTPRLPRVYLDEGGKTA